MGQTEYGVLKIQVFFDNRPLFDHRLGGAAVFDQDPTRDRDLALEAHVTLNFQRLTIY